MNLKIVGILCICLIILIIPHYNEASKLVLVGKFYTKNSADNNLKKNALLEKFVENGKQKEIQLKKYEDVIKNLFNDITKLNEKIEVLNNSNMSLQSKLQQQHLYYENKDKKTEQVKKKEFSKVSKKVINTNRPEIGNIYSKSLKKMSKN